MPVDPPVEASNVGVSPFPPALLPPLFLPPSPLAVPPVFPPPSPLAPPVDVALPVEVAPSAGLAPPPSSPPLGDEKRACVSLLPHAATVRRTTERHEKCSRSRRMGRKPFQTSMNHDCFPRCRDRTSRMNRSRANGRAAVLPSAVSHASASGWGNPRRRTISIWRSNPTSQYSLGAALQREGVRCIEEMRARLTANLDEGRIRRGFPPLCAPAWTGRITARHPGALHLRRRRPVARSRSNRCEFRRGAPPTGRILRG